MTATLNRTTLPELSRSVETPRYDPRAVKCGVVHLGVGNFHRAHQAAYFDDLLNAGHLVWGITGVSLRSPKTRDALIDQDYLYTLVEQSESHSYRVVGALQAILVAPEDPRAVIERLASNETTLITTTVTEKGYLLCDSGVDFDNPLFQSELDSCDAPSTVYGFLAAALVRRAKFGAGPVTVLCCDNIRNGGAVLRQGTERLLAERATVDAAWLSSNVSFISSVVDRVSPTTTELLKTTVQRELDAHDAWPVATEPFSLWVIEDLFVGEKPPLDTVGALFVPNVLPFERMKLAYLNAAHSVIAVLGYLLCEEHVHVALENKALQEFTRDFLRVDVLPVAPMPREVNGVVYIKDIFARFENAALPYKITQVCSDGSQKIQQRWFPTIDAAVSSGAESRRLALVLAAWVAAVERMVQTEEVQDPKRDELMASITASRSTSEMVEGTLAIAGAARWRFSSNPSFMNAVVSSFVSIRERGIESVLVEHTAQNNQRAARHA